MRRSLLALTILLAAAGCAARQSPPDDRPPQTPEEAQLDPRGGTSPWPLVGVGVVGLGVVAFVMLSSVAFFAAGN